MTENPLSGERLTIRARSLDASYGVSVETARQKVVAREGRVPLTEGPMNKKKFTLNKETVAKLTVQTGIRAGDQEISQACGIPNTTRTDRCSVSIHTTGHKLM